MDLHVVWFGILGVLLSALDEGILRVAGYHTPDPLEFFFQKRALGVRTSQILDMILPEYQRLMSALARSGAMGRPIRRGRMSDVTSSGSRARPR